MLSFKNELKDKDKLLYLCIGAALLILTIPYGGFYWHHCITPLFFLVAAALIAPKKKEGLNAILLIVLVILGFISVLTSQGNVQSGLYDFEKFLIFIVATLVGLSLADDLKLSRIIFYVATFTAIAGILACCKLLNVSEFVFLDGNFLRLQSFFRYANTACCFLGCGYFAFARIWMEEKKKWQLYCGSLILTALYFTFSKAGIPIFLFLATVFLFKNKKLSRVFLIQNVVAAILFVAMNYLVHIKLGAVLFFVIIAGILFTGTAKEDNRKSLYIWLGFMVLSIISGIALFIIKPDLAVTFIARTRYMRDSVGLFAENPLFGCGFGSWRVLQFQVQSSQYSVTHMHNSIMQIFTECGIPFGLIFLYLTVRGAMTSLKESRFSFFSIIALILIHSLIDFDLSYGSILLVLGLVTGSSLKRGKDTEENPKYVIIKSIPSYILITAILVTGIYMSVEYFMRSSFEKAYIEDNYEVAADKAESLSFICPKDAELALSRAALAQMKNQDSSVVIKHLENAKTLSPNDTEIFRQYAFAIMNDSNAILLCEEYMDMAPKQEKTYAVLKEQLSSLLDNSIISEETYTDSYDLVENRRIAENVIDRNLLLKNLKEK